MLKFEPREVSWVQYFHDQAVDSREYVKNNADKISVEIRDQLLSIVQWAETMERRDKPSAGMHLRTRGFNVLSGMHFKTERIFL